MPNKYLQNNLIIKSGKSLLIGTFFIYSLYINAITTDSMYIDKKMMLNELIVIGTRYRSNIKILSQTVSVIDRKIIERSKQQSLLPILNETVPGLFITSRGIMGYGVSNGAAGGISLRGLSGSSGRLMVMIDGHPQYAGIFGHPIADAYQSFLAERVEVLRGPASVLYGSNAMGGVVNIVTRIMQEDGINTNLHAGYGSYNTLETELTNRIRKGRFSSVISGSYNRTDGHRTDMNFEQYGGYAKLGYEMTDNWKLRGDVNVTHFNASYPGPVSAPLLDGDQRITRGMTSFAIENKYDKTSGAVSFFYNWGDGKNLIMTLPNPNGSGMLNQNSGEIENTGIEVQAAYRINRQWSVDGNYSYLHMKEPVIAAPEHKLYGGASFSHGRWNVSTGIQYIAGLYTQTDPVKTEDFVLWNLRASFRTTKWQDIWVRGENLLAQKYEINAGYPMPKVTVMGGVNMCF